MKILLPTGLSAAILAALAVTARMQVHHWANSTTLFTHADAVIPNNYVAKDELAVILSDAGRDDLAIEFCQQAAEWNPKYVGTFKTLGYIYTKNKKWAEAEEQLRAAAILEPENYNVQFFLACALEKRGKIGEAVDACNAAINIDPKAVPAQVKLGNLLVMQGKAEEAIEQFHVALELKPDSLETLNRLAWVLSTHRSPQLRNGAEALEMARRACAIKTDASSLVSLACAQAETGQFTQAAETAQKARELALSGNQKNIVTIIDDLQAAFHSGHAFREP